MEHSQIILNLLKEKGISRYRVAKDTGISESLFSKWESHPTSEISSRVLTQLSNYLDCSVDYLLDKENKPIEKKYKEIHADFSSIFNYEDAQRRYMSYIYQALSDLCLNFDLYRYLFHDKNIPDRYSWVSAFKYFVVSLCECSKIISVSFFTKSNKEIKQKIKMYKNIQIDLTSYISAQKNAIEKVDIFFSTWEKYGDFIRAVRNNIVHFDNEQNDYIKNMINKIGIATFLQDENGLFRFDNSHDWFLLTVEEIFEDFKYSNYKETIQETIFDICSKLFNSTYFYLHLLLQAYMKIYTKEDIVNNVKCIVPKESLKPDNYYLDDNNFLPKNVERDDEELLLKNYRLLTKQDKSHILCNVEETLKSANHEIIAAEQSSKPAVRNKKSRKS